MVNLGGLNEAQKSAVEYFSGPMMVLAGAGSGKTKMLVTKIAHLIEDQNLGPYRILALTFSNKAAREMRERVSQVSGIQAEALTITTFHSFCSRLLRVEADVLGLSKNFTIYDEDEGLIIIKNILGKYGISPKEISPYEVLYYIEGLKNKGVFLGRDQICSDLDKLDVDSQDPFFRYFTEYENELHKSNALDFGGLITSILALFYQHPSVLKRIQDRYEYILVDEYQDTNKAQFEILKLISGEKQKICVVGDEDQSIYSWRGADIHNILDFNKVFKNVKVFKLEQNYRCTGHIIQAASLLISNNQYRNKKELWTENQLGEKIQVKELETEKDEAIFVVGQIKKALLNSEYREKPDYSEMAIFYRNNYQSRPLEDALRNAKLPYKIIGGIKFYERKEIKDVIAYLRLIINPDDSLALSRIINVPSRGIGATTLKKLEEMASQLNVSLWIAIERVQTNSDQFGLKLSGKIKSSLTTFYNFVSECMLLHKSGNSTYTIFEKVIHESGYIEELKSIKDYESEARLENIYELGQAIKDFSESHPNSTVTDFIETIALDTSVTQEGLENQGEISLMTVHGAKGLEFHNVFVVGMEEGIFPSMKSIESGSMALEEERRLCYVAMTRSMKNLWMTFPRARYQWGQLKFNGPSRFLFELPKDKIIWDHKGSSSLDLNSNKNFDDFDFNQSYDDDAVKIYNGKSNNLVDIASKGALSKNFTVTKPSLNLPESKYKKGNVVHHSVYGKGTVVDTEGAGANEKVLILFPDGAKKRFLVKYAPITLEKN